MPLKDISGARSHLVLALSLGPGRPSHRPFLAQLASHKLSGQLLPPSPSGPSLCLSVDPPDPARGLIVASAQPSSFLCGSLSPQAQLVASQWTPRAKPVPPGGPPVPPSVGVLASSPCPECPLVSLFGPSASFRRLLRANLPFSPRSNLCGLGSSPAPGGLCRSESSGPRLRLSRTTRLMPHAGLSRLSFCPPRVPIGPRCPRVGFSRPGSRLLLLASAGPSIGFSIRPLQAQLQFSWRLLPMGVAFQASFLPPGGLNRRDTQKAPPEEALGRQMKGCRELDRSRAKRGCQGQNLGP
ncbi:hypothetical protein P7K49_019131 [Saguinus oedipus]|uniref:Uncharacterized protein n=1 Tax=Saguinus oedipus TaxID=9490 RepID=A0ABQ9UWM5_SAGOE|nr:hypothetical protein P7K49_019131 [Saguinus oedipus]